MPEPSARVYAAAPVRSASSRAAVRLGAAMVVAGAAFVAALYVVFVRTAEGQQLDHKALLEAHADPWLTTRIAAALNDLTIGISVAVLAAAMVVALVRGRTSYAIAAAALVGGANVTTQVLKHGLLTRPHLGYEWSNSLPSGHTTVAVSVAMALLLVVPAVSRGLLVLLGSVTASIVGVGVVVAGWHRPSDVLAALGVCLAWAGLVSLWLLLRTGAEVPARRTSGHPGVALAGAMVVVALAYAYGVRPEGSWRDLVGHGATVTAIGLGTALCLSLAARVMPAIR